ncbi:MAG: hypothetical protein V3V99_02225 [candidate division Zixibacteria bacterium]
MPTFEYNLYYVLLEAIKILGPAAGAAIVAIMVSRYHLKTKVIELAGTERAKGKELLFEMYKERYDRNIKGLQEFITAIYSCQAKIIIAKNEEEINDDKEGAKLLLKDIKSIFPHPETIISEPEIESMPEKEKICFIDQLKKFNEMEFEDMKTSKEFLEALDLSKNISFTLLKVSQDALDTKIKEIFS